MAPTNQIPIQFPSPVPPSQHVLLELPLELVKLIKTQTEDEPLTLTIKGRPTDATVICTAAKTYNLRSVQISNELVLLSKRNTTVKNDESVAAEELEYLDSLHEIMEITSTVPALERISEVLQSTNQEWNPEDESDKEDPDRQSGPARKRQRYTTEKMRSVVLASDKELDGGLRERNVLDVDGHLLRLPYQHLTPLLSQLLNSLLIHSNVTPPTSCSLNDITATLKSSPSNLSLALAKAVLERFGSTDASTFGDSTWTVDLKEVIRQIGLGLLDKLSFNQPKKLGVFEQEWMRAVGMNFEKDIEKFGGVTGLLEGNHIVDPPAALLAVQKGSTPLSTKFHHLIRPLSLLSLPFAPQARFNELFNIRSKWKPEEMKPFLEGCFEKGDTKARDKLVAKFVRVVREGKGKEEATYWYPKINK